MFNFSHTGSLLSPLCFYLKVLCWPKSLFRIFCKTLWKNPNEHFCQPNIGSTNFSFSVFIHLIHLIQPAVHLGNPSKTLDWWHPNIGGSWGSWKIHLFQTSECSTHCNLEALPAGYSAMRFHAFGPESSLLLAVLLFFSTYIVHSIPSPRLPPFPTPT